MLGRFGGRRNWAAGEARGVEGADADVGGRESWVRVREVCLGVCGVVLCGGGDLWEW